MTDFVKNFSPLRGECLLHAHSPAKKNKKNEKGQRPTAGGPRPQVDAFGDFFQRPKAAAVAASIQEVSHEQF